jgi:hypothetical protein
MSADFWDETWWNFSTFRRKVMLPFPRSTSDQNKKQQAESASTLKME